jgi:hypothetical protein
MNLRVCDGLVATLAGGGPLESVRWSIGLRDET